MNTVGAEPRPRPQTHPRVGVEGRVRGGPPVGPHCAEDTASALGEHGEGWEASQVNGPRGRQAPGRRVVYVSAAAVAEEHACTDSSYRGRN